MTKKERVALISLISSVSLTIVKLAVGLLIGSLALITDALHSGTDTIATFVTLVAVRLADKPADDDHPYGHGKFEDLAALGEATLLLVLAGGVAMEAWTRLSESAPPPAVGPVAFAVMIVEIGINLWRAWALNKTAKETGSRALAADAMHFASDVGSGLMVIIGFVATLMGVSWADPVTAAAVAVFIAWLGLRMIKRTVDELTDRVAPGMIAGLRRSVEALPGVVTINHLRVRTVGHHAFVDVSVNVPRTFGFEEITAVKGAIATAVAAGLADAEITSSCLPVAIDDESVRERVFLAASREKIPIHHVTIQHLGDRLSISLDLEVEGEMPLSQAHEVADRLERAIRLEIGADIEVETHLEPLDEDLMSGESVSDGRLVAVSEALRTAAAAVGVLDVHNVRARKLGQGGLYVAFHCRLDAALPASEVHRRVDAVERAVRGRFAEIVRIVSHPEPIDS